MKLLAQGHVATGAQMGFETRSSEFNIHICNYFEALLFPLLYLC